MWGGVTGVGGMSNPRVRDEVGSFAWEMPHTWSGDWSSLMGKDSIPGTGHCWVKGRTPGGSKLSQNKAYKEKAASSLGVSLSHALPQQGPEGRCTFGSSEQQRPPSRCR